MDDLVNKLPAGAVKWTLSGLFAGGALKGLSILLNKLMDRKIKQDEYGHEDSKDIVARIWAKVNEQEAKIQSLNKELYDVHLKNHESVTKLEVQTIRLEHCRQSMADLEAEIGTLKTEISRLNSILVAKP